MAGLIVSEIDVAQHLLEHKEEVLDSLRDRLQPVKDDSLLSSYIPDIIIDEIISGLIMEMGLNYEEASTIVDRAFVEKVFGKELFEL